MSCGGRPNSERPNTKAARSGLLPACARIACTSRQARWIGLSRKMPRPPLASNSLSTAETLQSMAFPASHLYRARRQRTFLAGADAAHHLGEIAEHAVARRANCRGGFRQAKLGERVFGDALLAAQIDALQRLLAKCLQSSQHGANGGS